MRKAFTMVELVFVIVIIGILSGIAISKMSATRDDATITKAKSTVASIRSAISSEVQRRMMEGNYTAIKNVGGTANGTYDTAIFDFYDCDNNGNHDANASRVLEYAPHSCKTASSTSCWVRDADASGQGRYTYKAPGGVGGSVKFKVENNRFDCDDNTLNPNADNQKLCRMLDR